MMMAENPKITVEVEAKGVQQAKSQTNDFKKALDLLVSTTTAMSISLQKIAEQTRKVDIVTSGASNSASNLNNSLTAVVGGATRSNAELGKLNATTTQAKNASQDYKKSLDALIANSTLTNLRLQQIAEQTKKVESETNKAKKETSGFQKAMEGLKQVVVAYFSLNTVKYIMQTADQMRMLEARTINASKSIALGVQNFAELKRIAGEAGVALDSTVQVFQRVANTKDSIGATNAELLKMTETVSKLGVLSGASYEAQKNGLVQFAQAMSGGIVRAEEFNSLLENIPEVANAIAEGLGVSIGQLRRMVLEGKLLSKDVFNVLVEKADEVNKKFEKMPVTFDRIRTQASITFGTLVSDIDKSTDASGTLIRFVGRIGKGINDLMPTLKRVFTYLIVGAKASGNLVMSVFDGIVFVISASVENITRSIKQIVNLYNSVESKITKGKFQAPTAGLDETISVSKSFRKSSGRGVASNLNSFGANFLKSLEVAYGNPLQGKPSTATISDRRGSVETPLGSTGGGGKKGTGGKTQAEQELDRYKDALKTLKDKAREAMLEVQGMDKAINALAGGGLKAYEAQVKQNEGLGRYNELMGDYLGKGKQELELIAQRIVKQEQDIDLKKKQLELSVKLAEAQRDINIEENTAKQLRDAFLNGGLAEYELKKRQLEIEERKRTLLGDGNATEEQKKQAQQIAEQEDRIARSKTLLEQQVEDAKQASEAIRNALRSAFDNTIEHMVNGTTTFKEVMVGLLRQVAVQLIKVYTLQLLMGVIGRGQTGGADAGAFGGRLTGIFDKLGTTFKVPVITANPTTGRATGGAVSANVPYVVGEAGREMFVPRSAGNIIPNYAMSKTGGGGAITVVNNMTINTQEGDDKNSIMEAGKALSAMMETKVRQILQVESRQGGMLHRSFA